MTAQKLALLFAAAAMLAATTSGSEQARAKPFYEGKTIKIVVGSGPGAGNDIRTRLFARHAPDHIPGHPRVIVENMGGGGGLRARNFLYNIAKPDGLTIAEIIRGTALQDAIGEKAAHFKAAEFQWIGNMTVASATCEGRVDRIGNTLKEAIALSKKHQLRDAESGIGNAGAITAKLLKVFTGINLRLVVGYHGGSAIDLAIRRGEADMRCGGSWISDKTRKRHLFARLGGKPFAAVILQVSKVRLPDLPDVPTLMEIAPNKKWRSVAEMITLTYRNAFPLLAPPKTPKALVNILRKAFWATMHDPKYLADARKIGYTDDEPLKGEEVQELVTRIVTQPAAIRDRLEKLVVRTH